MKLGSSDSGIKVEEMQTNSDVIEGNKEGDEKERI